MLVGDVVEKTSGSGSQIKHGPFTDYSKTDAIKVHVLRNVLSSTNVVKARTQADEVRVHF